MKCRKQWLYLKDTKRVLQYLSMSENQWNITKPRHSPCYADAWTHIKNMLVYTLCAQFKEGDQVCKTTKKLDQAKELVEAGFEFICGIDGVKLFRKRK